MYASFEGKGAKGDYRWLSYLMGRITAIESQLGMSLLEAVIALAIAGLVIPGVLLGLSVASTSVDDIYERSLLLELGQSEIEDIQRQGYQEDAADYTLVSTPEGYAIEVSVAKSATYTYPAPKSTETEETVQSVTVTVTGVRDSLELQAYKVRR